MKDWMNQAIRSFYEEKKSVVEIAHETGKNKATISKYLRSHNLEKYNEEKKSRKEQAYLRKLKGNRERKRLVDQERKKDIEVQFEKEILRRQHEQDVRGMCRVSTGNILGMWETGYLRSAYEQQGKNLVRRNWTSCGAAVPTTGLPRKI